METLSNRNVTLSQLSEQVQEGVKDEVPQFLKHTFEEILETLLGRGKYERCGSLTLYRYGYWIKVFSGKSSKARSKTKKTTRPQRVPSPGP